MNTIVVAGSGPSLTQEQCDLTCGHDVLAISNAHEMLPHAKWVYAHDHDWWKTYAHKVKHTAKYTGSKQAAREFGLTFVGTTVARRTVNGSPSVELGQLANCSNSGSQGINLAYLFGARRIILIGFDFKYSAEGKRHFFGNHPPTIGNAAGLVNWMERLHPLVKGMNALGVELLNCSIDTAIPETLIPRCDLRNALWYGQAM